MDLHNSVVKHQDQYTQHRSTTQQTTNLNLPKQTQWKLKYKLVSCSRTADNDKVSQRLQNCVICVDKAL